MVVGRLVNLWAGGGFERDGTISVTNIGQRTDNFVRFPGGRGGRQLVLLNTHCNSRLHDFTTQ